jgi:O-antigen ligase/tetratricopeptide (TPR) repeat protein
MKPSSQPNGAPARADRCFRAAIEAVVLALVCLAPWLLGSVEPAFEGLLYAGVALLLLLWAARAVVAGSLTWRSCPVGACLAALFLYGVLQVVPLPRPVLQRLSPETARLYDELMPAEREVLPGSNPVPAAVLPAGETLSLYPGATRAELTRLLAVFLFFAAVRSNVASPASLRRLAVAATANGAALALFGFLQFLGAPRNTVFWTIPAPDGATVFGPFLCRNHFPFYVNLCVGLGVGLLLSLRRDGDRASLSPLGMLRRPAALWTALALAVMLASVAFCLSRGGLLALAGGGVVCAAFSRLRGQGLGLPGGAVVTAALGLGLVAWLGFAPIQARLATLWQGDASHGRADLWSELTGAAKDFPLFGTGYGTIPQVEVLYRSSPDCRLVEHAHNDYLEALVEGGAVRLLLGVAAVLLVYRAGWLALGRRGGGPVHGLVLGCLFGFTTLVIHSIVDFGIHVPAVVVLAAVVCAHLSALGETSPAPTREKVSPRTRLAGLAAATVAVLLAGTLCAEGWRMTLTQSLRLGASAAQDDKSRLALLEAAARASPERAELQVEAARAHLSRWESEVAGGDAESGRAHLLAALAHCVQARDLCPLTAAAHVRLGAHAGEFEKADPRGDYLRRACRVFPSDPEVFYLAGLMALYDGHAEQAARDWRRSLELSDRFLESILARGQRAFTDEELTARVLPDRPALLHAAAIELYPDSDGPLRRTFFERALALLAEPGRSLSPADLRLRGVLLEGLGEPEKAVAAYEAALLRDPRQAGWRYELARLLRRQGRLEDARRQLLDVLAEQPGHQDGRQMLDTVRRELAERR